MAKSQNKAKRLKLDKNDIVCPNCRTILNVSFELINEDYIQCDNCEKVIDNPLSKSGKFIVCNNCGINHELPKSIENDLNITCRDCGQEMANIYSDKYNPIACPNCFNEAHLGEEFLGDNNLICPFCGDEFKNPIKESKWGEDKTNNKKGKTNGNLRVSFGGQWFLFDSKTKIFVNNELHSTHSTKKGFLAIIPIESNSIQLKVVLGGIKSTVFEIDELNLGTNYFLELFYDDFRGRYSNDFNLKEYG